MPKTLASPGELRTHIARAISDAMAARQLNATAVQAGRSWRHVAKRGMLLLLLALGTSPQNLSADDSQKEFQLALPGFRYQFPRDHGSHDEFRTEWWYYTGHLMAKNGRQFGYELTFFRRAIAPEQTKNNPSRWAITQLYLAHLALTDLDRKQFRYAEKVSRAGLGKAGATREKLDLWIDRWSAQALPGEPIRFRLQAAHEGVRIELTLNPTKPLVIHGTGGISRKGSEAGQASHYYSFTRLATEGTVTVGEDRLAVTGTSWMDHEFGSADLGHDLVGWDWFSLQLADHTELMLYRLRRADGSSDPASSGTVVSADGRAQPLALSDVQIEPLAFWTSPQSGARYPSRWRLSSRSLSLYVEITPLLAEQELITRRSTQVTYWEGAVHVSGTQSGRSISGQGYVELTGYAERFRQRL